eukprot:2415462-Prymnesium_polylepis.1
MPPTLRLRHLRWRRAVPGVVLRVARSPSCGLTHSRTRPDPQPLRKAMRLLLGHELLGLWRR